MGRYNTTGAQREYSNRDRPTDTVGVQLTQAGWGSHGDHPFVWNHTLERTPSASPIRDDDS